MNPRALRKKLVNADPGAKARQAAGFMQKDQGAITGWPRGA